MIIGITLLIFDLVLLVYFYFRNLTHFIILTIINFTFAQFVLHKIGFIFAPSLFNAIYILIVFFIIVESVRNAKYLSFFNNNLRRFFIYIIILVSYIIIIDLLRGIHPGYHLSLIKHYYWGLLLFLVIICRPKMVNIRKIDNFFLLVIIVQSIIGIFQYLLPDVSEFFRISNYTWRGENVQVFTKDVFLYGNIVIGTLFRMANFGNLLGLLTVYIIAKNQIENNGYFKPFIYYIGIFISIIAILLTGIRTSVLTLLVGLFVAFFLLNRKRFWQLSLSIFGLLFAFIGQLVILGQQSILGNVQTENPLLRVAGLFYLFSGNLDISNLTLIRSISIIDELIENPFIGAGTYYVSGYEGINSITDAFLIFHGVEFGLIGLVILFLPYFYFFYASKKYARNAQRLAVILFVVLILQTITDNGLFYLEANMLFWLILTVNFRFYFYHKNTDLYNKISTL